MKRRLLGALSLVLLSLAALPGVQLAHAQPVFEANVTFPEQRDIANPPVFREEGNQVSGTRVVALPRIDDLDLHLVVNPNQLVDRADCEMRLEVKINDVAAGTVTVRAGQQAVDAFLRPAESVQPVVSGANNNYTFLLRVAATPPAGCGTITLPWRPQASTWHLEVEDVPGNARPRGTIGGPYQVNEGGSVPMAAAGTDPEGEQLTFAWDFDGDGQFDDGQGAAAVFDARAIDGPVQQPVKLRLSDAGGAFREL
ncbi:MAG: hypothetical protein FJ125_03400, partial [Deltaproteobacteria bacterium]|nr:hypothetical protein [Deltaproteobacteria bacterium]